MKQNVKVRCAQQYFIVEGQRFEPGSLIVTRRNNERIENFDSIVTISASTLNRKIFTARSGFVDQGKDLGSGNLSVLKMPKIAVLYGNQTSSLSSGEIWHFFEQQIYFPITQIGTENFQNAEITAYSVLIIPQGTYKLFDEPTLEKLSAWVLAGGKLILISEAMNSFADQKGFGLQKYSSEDEKNNADTRMKEEQERRGLMRYEAVQRQDISKSISGAIYKVSLDNSHPLGFGMGKTYYTLKTNEIRFGLLNKGWNVAYFSNDVQPIQGFAGSDANRTLRNSLLLGVEEKGQGEIVYLVDNPLFRSFWENGKMLFANAVFMVGQ
jgi:hypothetical protein